MMSCVCVLNLRFVLRCVVYMIAIHFHFTLWQRYSLPMDARDSGGQCSSLASC